MTDRQDEKALLSARLEPSLLADVRAKAEERAIPVSEAVREALRLWVRSEGRMTHSRTPDQFFVRLLRDQLVHAEKPRVAELIDNARKQQMQLQGDLQALSDRRRAVSEQAKLIGEAAEQLRSRVQRIEADMEQMRREFERASAEYERARAQLADIYAEEQSLATASNRMLQVREELEHLLETLGKEDTKRERGGGDLDQ